MKSRRMRRVGQAEGIGEKRNTYVIIRKARRKETTRKTNTEMRG
jgi:hypothetical protein